jgi:hypothetical protein
MRRHWFDLGLAAVLAFLAVGCVSALISAVTAQSVDHSQLAPTVMAVALIIGAFVVRASWTVR